VNDTSHFSNKTPPFLENTRKTRNIKVTFYNTLSKKTHCRTKYGTLSVRNIRNTFLTFRYAPLLPSEQPQFIRGMGLNSSGLWDSIHQGYGTQFIRTMGLNSSGLWDSIHQGNGTDSIHQGYGTDSIHQGYGTQFIRGIGLNSSLHLHYI
jgi:hypothetical protein